MQDHIVERALECANYIIDKEATIRETAKVFGVSKTTVHLDITERLEKINPAIKKDVDRVIERNTEERNFRAGMATREKYENGYKLERKVKEMDLIKIENKEGQLVVSSRDVAENFDKRHDSVLRDIDNLVSNIGTPQNCGMLFIESEYLNSNNRVFKEYLLTRDGFSLLVMGFTGQKALEWKLKYIEAFNKMEQQLLDPYQGLSKELQAIFSIDKKQQEHEERILKLENNTTIDYGQQQDLQNIARKNVVDFVGGKNSPAYKDKSLRSKIFSTMWSGYKDYFSVNSYKNTLRKDYNKATMYLRNWRPQGKLLREIEQLNGQLVM